MFEEVGKLAKSMMEIKYTPIGLSVVRLIKVEKNILEIQNVEIIDGTPVLDIKPYVPEFTTNDGIKIGWLEKNVHKLQQLKDDGRFS
ncbi:MULTISPECIES: TrmO family methyltransferase [unclassified Petrotoga]|uniref:TrmO family methyltransferase domain-containing protein n=2 Tax=unclassified Petrotoga TaxID=2620614 RepID=UPI0018EBF632|nr:MULTISPECIES: TrmO family methyltransferase [unclassified Petrotoga]